MIHLLSHPAVLILGAVLLLIAVRQIGRFRFQLWQIMLLGALAALVSGAIGWRAALRSIDLDVLLFLFGMFIIGEALHSSGYLYHLAHRLFSRARTLDRLLLYLLFAAGALSAVLMNDTIAIIGTPLVLMYARSHGLPPRALLLALCIAVTTGSVASPIGNPQNLLIAIGGQVPNPFVTFLWYLAIPTILNLLLAYGFLKLYYRDHWHDEPLRHDEPAISDPALARLGAVALTIVGAMTLTKIAAVTLHTGFDFALTYIAVFGAAPILLFSRRRLQVCTHIDWTILVFFAAMFVLMEAVWQTGLVQALMVFGDVKLSSVPMILGAGVIVSQLVSNVPMVALCLPLTAQTGGTIGMMALAAGSTIAGNLLIMGAASNVIVIQQAERENETITFWEFARIGIPLTALQIAVIYGWLTLLSH